MPPRSASFSKNAWAKGSCGAPLHPSKKTSRNTHSQPPATLAKPNSTTSVQKARSRSSSYSKTAVFNGALPTHTHNPFSRSGIFRVLADRLVIGDALGKGAFGEVFTVSPTTPLADSNMRMAAKFFSDCTKQTSIRNEFEALLKLRRKPGIIQIINLPLMVDGAMVGYAMEIGSGSLKKIRSETPLSPEETLVLAKDLIAGGCSLETAGLVHRDCKPDNVVKVGARWKKVDFGLVTTEGAPFQDCGSVLYRSPESYGIQDTRPYRTSSKQDVFADGLILAETLLMLLQPDLKRPKTIIHTQKGLNATALLAVRVAKTYKTYFYTPAVARLAEVTRQFPPLAELVALVINMIDADPEARPSFFECREVLEALEEYEFGHYR